MKAEVTLTQQTTTQMELLMLDFGKLIMSTGDNVMEVVHHAIQTPTLNAPKKFMHGEEIHGDYGQPQKDADADDLIEKSLKTYSNITLRPRYYLVKLKFL